MSDFKPGDIVDITIKGARVIRQELAVVVVELGVGGDVVAIPKFAAIERVSPAEWPPRLGDLWRDRERDLWFCLGDEEMVVAPGAATMHPDLILNKYGPLTLVHRETGKGTEPTYEQSWRQACGDLDCTWPNCAHDAHKRAM